MIERREMKIKKTTKEWFSQTSSIHTHVYTCLDASCFVVNNTDMIKISHVMTTDTNQQRYVLLCIVYNFVFTRMHDIRWNIMYVRYVLQAKSNPVRFHWTCQQFISLLDKQMNLMLCKQDWSKFSLDWVLAARCVRVIHAQCVLQFALLSRTLLRSSSNNEPSDPPYRIVNFLCFRFDSYSMTNNNDLLNGKGLETRRHMNESSRRCLIHMNVSSCFDT